MNTSEKTVDTYQMVTNRICEQLQKGVVPWKQPWAEGGLPQNLISLRHYTGINLLLLASYNYELNYFLTFRQVKDAGGWIKTGERSQLVVFWKWVEKAPDDTGDMKKIPFLRYYTVFNVSQCEGLPEGMIPKVEKKEHKPLEACEQIIASMPQCPVIEHKDQRAFYNPFRDYINMPKKHSFDSGEEYYATLFHELIHSTGHKSRLERKGLTEMSEFGSDKYSFEELVAEIGACYLSSHAGIGSAVFANNVAYLQGWLKVLQNDKKFIVLASAQAQKAVDFILDIKRTPHEEKENPTTVSATD